MHALAQEAVEAVESAPFGFTLDAWAVVFVTAVLIPLAIGIFTKAKASPWLKSLLNLVLTAVATLIAANMNDNGQAVISKETFMVWVVGFIASVGTYLGVYQNLPTPAGRANGINNLAPSFGVGREKPTYIETEQAAGPA